MSAQIEADKLREEAKSRLHAMLCIMGRNDRSAVERIVDCIIGATLLEGAALHSEALAQQPSAESYP
jgi:hypothetical protein